MGAVVFKLLQLGDFDCQIGHLVSLAAIQTSRSRNATTFYNDKCYQNGCKQESGTVGYEKGQEVVKVIPDEFIGMHDFP